MPRLRVLLADPDSTLRRALCERLSAAGFETAAASDGSAALRIGRTNVDLVVVSAELGGVGGYDVVRALRDERVRKPIVLLMSARADELDRILAYEIGADDVVPKPFSARELVARLRALVRRSNMTREGPGRLRYGRLEVDEPAREARVDGCTVALKPREFGLLLVLARHPGIALSRVSLLERVWGFDFNGDERTVDVHVRRLRLKIEEQHGIPRCVHTVHGFGYKFAPVS